MKPDNFSVNFYVQETFTHKDDDDTMRTFLVGEMKRFIKEFPGYPEVLKLRLDIDSRIVGHVKSNMGIETARLKRLRPPYLNEPGIGIIWPGTNQLTIIDGNHRVVKRHRNGLRFINMFGFRPPFWENFMVPAHLAKQIYESRDVLNCESNMLEFERQRAGTASGRFSATAPALSQWPKNRDHG